MIVIVDYNMGNVGSIANMIKKVGGESLITGEKEKIKSASKLILPGVGAFDSGMQNIKEMGLFEILCERVLEAKIPILGVCLGMQLLTKGSEEGSLPGLGWIDAETIKFPSEIDGKGKLRVPHMGWNFVSAERENKLFDEMYENPRFYFVHSYYVKCKDSSDVLGETNYGVTFTSSVNRENIWGTQFHPEKSHKFGMKLYHNFVHKI